MKELLRKAALFTALAGSADGVHQKHMDEAMAELEAGGELAKRIVGFGSAGFLPPSPAVGPMRPSGFPKSG